MDSLYEHIDICVVFPADTSDVKPKLTLQQAADMVLKLYGVRVTKISTLPSYIDQNILVVDGDGTKYVLKIMNSEDSKHPAQLAMQTLAMSLLQQHGVPTQMVVPTTTGELMNLEEIGKRIKTAC